MKAWDGQEIIEIYRTDPYYGNRTKVNFET
jgi:hypothetical protein